VSSVGSALATARAVTRSQLVVLRHFLARLGWIILAALAATAACWGFGYAGAAYRGAAAPAPSAPPDPLDPAGIDATVAAEAPRGVREIEAYLAAGRSDRRQVRHGDGDGDSHTASP